MPRNRQQFVVSDVNLRGAEKGNMLLVLERIELVFPKRNRGGIL